MDFGAVNPTVCLWIAVDNSDNIYVFNEYYNNGQTAQSHANIIQGMTDPNYPVRMTYGDPSAQQEMLDYANYGLVVTPALKIFSGDQDWVVAGIEKVRQALKINSQTGRPRLIIHPRCVNLIREIESCHWEESKSTGMIKDIPHKEDDHCVDALRYFMVSYSQPDVDYEFEHRTFTNSYTGYSSVSYD